MRADFIIDNPPYNQKQYWKPSLEGDPRWLFEKPDTKNANYAWLSLMYVKLTPRGKAAILMPNGATTSNTTDDYTLQKKMLEEGKVEAILALPNKLFSNVSISVQCWILNRGKTDNRVLFINADESDKMSEEEIKEDLKKTPAELFELLKEGRELEERVKKLLQSEIE